MGSVGNFWKNLNGNNGNDKDEVEIKPGNVVEEKIQPSKTTTDEEIDALIDSLEKERQKKVVEKEINVTKKQEEKTITFNTDLFKQVSSEQKGNMKNTNEQQKAQKGVHKQKNEQAVQKNKKESQVDKVKETGKKATIITKSTIIAGNISTEDDLIIDGSVCGDVDCKGELTISGEVAGNAVAASINIKTSKFDGDVRSEGKIDINEGTVVLGNIYGESANIAGAVKGEIIVTNEARLEPTAIVKGNIRAKSVQIEHGAVLQGFCELAYESMDLDDFFGEVATEDDELDIQMPSVAEEKIEDINENVKESVVEEVENTVETVEAIEETTVSENVEEKKEETSEEKDDEDTIKEFELVDDEADNKKEFMQEMEDNYSNFMDQLKIDSDN